MIPSMDHGYYNHCYIDLYFLRIYYYDFYQMMCGYDLMRYYSTSIGKKGFEDINLNAFLF